MRKPRKRADRVPDPAGATVLVLDDDEGLTTALVSRLAYNNLDTVGYVSPSHFLSAAKAGRLRDIKLMFFDMRLGPDPSGHMITAVDMIPAAKTYAPHARILIFTQKDISLEDCVHCVRLGALGLIPKSDDADGLLLAANVYTQAGDPLQATEEVIKELWRRAHDAPDDTKGMIWEMLVANLLGTVGGLSMIANNNLRSAGEDDLVLENQATEGFWREVRSLNIVVECKHRSSPPEKADFHILRAKADAKAHCRVGIMASWLPVSKGFRELQRDEEDHSLIYAIDQNHVRDMIGKSPAERGVYLKNLFSAQI